MTTMDYTETMQALRRLKVKTWSLACLGCGYEHNCFVHGCAILRNAEEHMEAQLHLFDAFDAAIRENEELERMLAESEAAGSDLTRQLAAARKELAEVKAERDAALKGGEG